MSTFYADGYRDGYNGEPCSPPDDYVRGDGISTDVYGQEYCAGYAAAIREFDDSMPIIPSRSGADF